MAYIKVRFDDLENLYRRIYKDYAQIHQALKNLSVSVKTIINTNAMAGETADAIKEYVAVYNVIGSLIDGLLYLHLSNYMVYKNEYNPNTDTANHAIINTSQIDEIRTSMDGFGLMAKDIASKASDVVSSVADIVSTRVSYKSDKRDHCCRILDTLVQEVEELESKHKDADFRLTGQYIESIANLIKSSKNKKSSQKSFKTVDYGALSKAIGTYLLAQTAIDSDSLSKALENQESIDSLLEAEAAEQAAYESRAETAENTKTFIKIVTATGCLIIAFIPGANAAEFAIIGVAEGLGLSTLDEWKEHGNDFQAYDYGQIFFDGGISGLEYLATGYWTVGAGADISGWEKILLATAFSGGEASIKALYEQMKENGVNIQDYDMLEVAEDTAVDAGIKFIEELCGAEWKKPEVSKAKSLLGELIRKLGSKLSEKGFETWVNALVDGKSVEDILADLDEADRDILVEAVEVLCGGVKSTYKPSK